MPKFCKRKKKRTPNRRGSRRAQAVDDIDTLDLSLIETDPKTLIQNLELSLEVNPYIITVDVLTTLSESIATVPKLREAGIASFFLRLILEPEHLSELESGEFPPWIFPLNGLVNVCIAMDRQPLPDVDATIKSELKGSFEKILDLLYLSSEKTIRSDSRDAKEVRSEVARLMRCYLVVEGLYSPSVHSDKAVVLMLNCWILPTDNRLEVCETIEALFEFFDASYHDQLATRGLAALNHTQEVMEHVKRLLEDRNLINKPLAYEIKATLFFAASSRASDFLQADLVSRTISAIFRQIQVPVETRGYPATYNVMLWGVSLLNALLAGSSNETAMLTELVQAGYLSLTGEMYLMSPFCPIITTPFRTVLDNMRHIAQCTSPKSGCTHHLAETPQFLSAVKKHVSRVFPVYNARLYDSKSTFREGVAMSIVNWNNLCLDLGIRDDEIRKGWREKKLCGYALCPDRADTHGPDISKPTSTRCSACGMIYYDRADCQKRYGVSGPGGVNPTDDIFPHTQRLVEAQMGMQAVQGEENLIKCRGCGLKYFCEQ